MNTNTNTITVTPRVNVISLSGSQSAHLIKGCLEVLARIDDRTTLIEFSKAGTESLTRLLTKPTPNTLTIEADLKAARLHIMAQADNVGSHVKQAIIHRRTIAALRKENKHLINLVNVASDQSTD